MAKRTCSIDGCDRTHYARGWCQKHYMRWWQHGNPTHTAKPGPKPTHGCKMEGCEQPHQARGWCRKHYQRWQRTGHPEGDTPERRFKRHTKVTVDGCWEWTASRFADGYGQFSVDGRTVHAHRWAYEHYVGQVSNRLELDHLCRNRACVNPDHLEAVTHRENVLRGTSPIAENVTKTHCPAGHPYSGPNLYRRPDGGRGCQECRRRRRRESEKRSRSY